MAELVDQPLASLGLLHDTLLVVLPQRTRQLVVVHCRTVLPLTPESGNLHGVHNLEDALLSIDPVDVVGVEGRLEEKLLDELPEMDVGAGPGGALDGGLSFLLFLIWGTEA